MLAQQQAAKWEKYNVEELRWLLSLCSSDGSQDLATGLLMGGPVTVLLVVIITVIIMLLSVQATTHPLERLSRQQAEVTTLLE